MTREPRLSKAEVAVNGLVPSLVKLLDNWSRGDLQKETQFRDSLLGFLRGAIPEGCRVEREYRHGGTTADLFLSWKGVLSSSGIFIEIKRNLNKKATLDRLVGQLEGLEPGKRTILLVLVGDTDDALLGRLREKYKGLIAGDWEDHPMGIVVKG